MALLASKGPVPEGAVILTPKEAIDYQWNQIDNWPNWVDVWPFRIGIPLLIGLGGITSLRINNVVRGKLHLRQFGKMISHYTVGLASVIVTGAGHYLFVSNDILIYKATCPVCIESKAVLIQLSSAILYPTLLSTVTNFVLANKYATYRIPYYSDAKGILKFYLNLAAPLSKKLPVFVTLNLLGAGFITYSESESLRVIRTKLYEKATGLDVIETEPSTTNTSTIPLTESSNKEK